MQRPERALRERIGPEVVEELVGRDDATPGDEQTRKDLPFARRARRRAVHLGGAEHAEPHGDILASTSQVRFAKFLPMYTTSALEHVETLFAAFAAGDTARVVDGWHADARWYPITPGGPWTEPKTRDEYFGEVLGSWYADRPDYVIHHVQLHEVGGLVVAGLTTSAGRGLIVYRVADGKVAECWSINADGRDSTDGF